MTAFQQLEGIVLDWAGTTVDHGCMAPAIVFQKIFQQRGVEITAAQAREPMGRAKRDHIAAVAAMPLVASRWHEVFGRECSSTDVDAMYADFLPLQKEILGDHSEVIAGVAPVVDECRRSGLRIGSSTGYTQELMSVVVPAAAANGYSPDCVLCSEDAPIGRPAPFLLYEAAMRLKISRLWHVVKVDDTAVGIQAGRNAGCWTVGVTSTGNGVGLSAADWSLLGHSEQAARRESAGAVLQDAGCHFLVETVADLMPILREIDSRLVAGERPGQI